MTRRFLQLTSRIGRRYGIVPTRIRLNDLELQFYRIKEPDRVLDETVAEEDRRKQTPRSATSEPPRMPYWAELWDSSLALGQIISRSRRDNQSVLDLGCGMGLAGAAAAAMGARVLFADLETPALLLARLNTLTWQDRVRARRVNWQSDRLRENFDLIVGADILYERAQWEPLETFWRGHLNANGQILLAEPGRSGCDEFATWIAMRGWLVTDSLEPVTTMASKVRIFALTKNARDSDKETAGVSKCTEEPSAPCESGLDQTL